MTIEGRDRLLDLYARELAYLREKGASFADENRTVASRLSLSAQQSSDPHVERLLESFAFLTARIQQDIEDELPLITASLLGALYPQLVSPIPSMAIATLTPDAAGIKATTGVTVEKGTPLFAEPKSGPACRFRTAYTVTLWPLEIGPKAPRFDAADMLLTPEQRGSAAKVLVLPIAVLPGGMPLEKLRVSRLRFYIGGSRFDAFALYDLLFANREVRAYARGADGETLLPARLEPAGFERADDILPYPDNAHPGHRLVQEYFAFPDKFLFFDAILPDQLPEGTTMELVILLDEPPPATLSLRSDTFRLGCTPVVNLFPKTTEPIRLDHLTPEYRLIADVRRERTTEIHSIQRVLSTGQSDRGEARVYDPFFSYAHRAADDDTLRAFWHARRAPCARADVPGSDMWLSLVDLAFQPARLPVEAVYAETLCTNRDLAEEIDEETILQFERGGVAATARCTTKPTQQIEPPAGGDALWRLVSNLTLGHVALSDGPPTMAGTPAREIGAGGGEALRETLRSYIFAGDSAAERQILGIRELRTRAVTRRVHREAWRGFCTGTEITLVLDETKLAGASVVLFTSMLSRFFAQFAHINTFTELVLKTSDPAREWNPWPRMAGDVTLL